MGVGQTWQNVTVSRANNVTYSNTTGKPIQVQVGCNSNTSGWGYFKVDGVNVSSIYINASDQILIITSVVIPSGSTYSLSMPGTIFNLNWVELR